MTLEDWLKQHFKTDDAKSALKQIGHITYKLPINEEVEKTSLLKNRVSVLFCTGMLST